VILFENYKNKKKYKIMKKVKSFEEFNHVNELSTGMANNAAIAARKKGYDYNKKDDDIGVEKSYRQSNRFSAYINPVFKKRIEKLGFNISKVDDTVILLTLDDIVINVFPSSYNLNKSTNVLDDTILNKVNRAIKLSQEELNNMIKDRKTI
jgi:hypothetical protein